MKKYILVASAFCALSSCTHKEVRTPASAPAPFSEDGVAAVNEIFGSDSPTARYRRELKIHFYTNSDKQYLSATAKKAIGEALQKTLLENSEGSLPKLALGHIKGAMLDNFFKTVNFYKITNTGLQLDLTFAPTANNRNSFASEFNSNQLIDINQLGSLSERWAQAENPTFLGTLYKNSLLIPKEGKFDYIGGVVSLYVEILDATPGFGLPSKNALKGFVRYRRYYRGNSNLGGISCDKYDIRAQARGPSVPMFYTVDLYKNFDLKNLVPTDETVEVFPGFIIASGEGRRELAAFGDKDFGKTIRTTNFSVIDKSHSSVGSFYLKKISYNVADKKIDIAKSEIGAITLKGNRDSALSRGRQQFLQKCEPALRKFLRLAEAVPGDLL